jgi:uncharacterized protein involved in exopolysaccharide biosynthesis
MYNDDLSMTSSHITLRQLVAPLMRHRIALVVTFLAILGVAGLVAYLAPPAYEADMLLLVRRERVDPVVSGDPESPSRQTATDISESELLSEIELLRSRDLLEQVAIDAGLHDPARFDDEARERAARAAAIRRLRSRIQATAVRRTAMIRVSYTGATPEEAHRVLVRLQERYLDKHLAVHRAPGTRQFFGEQVDRARTELHEAQQHLSDFASREQVIAPDVEKTALLQQLAMFESALEQARADAADATRRLAATEAQLAGTPDRQVTAIRTGSNSNLIGQLKSRILEMELQRDEMLRKFTPAYPPVVQLDGQLALARATLERAEQAPVLDETTDQNPTHQWLRNEIARIRPERDALSARVAAMTRTVNEYRDRARRLEEVSMEQQELTRAVKTAEDTYVLYEQRQEEARIADALDTTRIANVTIADQPRIPQAPSQAHRALILWAGLFTAIAGAVAAAYVLDWLQPRYGSARDVQESLQIPVLASVSAD